jgi:hypothetical protein
VSTKPGRASGVAALLVGTLTALAALTGPAFAQVDPGDTTPPETFIDSGPAGTSADTSPDFHFSADEAGVTFECSLDSAPFASCASPTTLNGLGDGSHTFRVQATDAAGNLDTSPATRTWTVRKPDTTPPETTIDSGPSGTVEETQATFTFSSSESGATFECSKDGGDFFSCTTGKTYWGYGEGLHNFRVQAVDAAGNRDASPAIREWTIRRPTTTTPPPTTATTAPTTNTTAPSNNDGPPSSGGGIFIPPSSSGGKATTTTGKPGKSTTTTGKPGKDDETTTTTTTTVAPGPVAAPPGALVLPGLSGDGGYTAAKGAEEGALAVGEPHHKRKTTGVLIGFGAALVLLILGGGGVMWWRRPGRYMPA